MQMAHLIATFYATSEQWLNIAAALERTGDKRLAQEIRNSLARPRNAWRVRADIDVPLRFRNGSIAKLQAYCDAN